MGESEEDDAKPFYDFFFDGGVAVLGAIVECLRMNTKNTEEGRSVLGKKKDKYYKEGTV